MTTLKYQAHARVEDLHVGECTVHRASGSGGARWWLLWFHALRETDGQPETFCVPVAPFGAFNEHGPGGKTWGLTLTGFGTWSVSPSINVLQDRDAVAGTHELPSLWHQTPDILDVPDSEPWAAGAAP